MKGAANKDPKDHLVDLFLRAPIGFLYELVDQYPDAVKRGKSQADVGFASLKALASSAGDQYSDVTKEMLVESASFLRIMAARLDQAADRMNDEGNLVSKEPINGYDKMTAKEVVAEVKAGSKQTAESVMEYESANKRRKSVLSAAEKLING